MRFPVVAPNTQDVETYRFFEGVVSNLKDLYEVVYPVTQYGVKNDGATDNTNALDSIINNAAVGSVLYFPEGTYILTAIAIDKQLKLSGPGTIKMKNAGATASTPFITVSASNVWIDGLTIDGNKANQTLTGNDLLYADLVRVSSGSDYCRIKNCTLQNALAHCVGARCVDDLLVERCKMDNWHEGNLGAVWLATNQGDSTESANRNKIVNNRINGATSNSSCIKFSGTSSYPINGSRIEGNVVTVGDAASTTTETLGIELWSASGIGVYDSIVSQNTVYADNTTNEYIYGISLAGGGCSRATVVNNTVLDCQVYGIEIGNSDQVTITANNVALSSSATKSSPGIMLNDSNYCGVNSNTISNYTIGVQAYSGTSAGATQNIVANNLISLPASANTVGVWLQSNNAAATVNSNIVSQNILVGVYGTSLQYAISLEMDYGEMTSNVIASNQIISCQVGVTQKDDTNTYFLNNNFLSVTTTFGGSGGTGTKKVTYDSANGTYIIDHGTSTGLAVSEFVNHGLSGSGAATTGFIRMKQADGIYFRNEAGDGNVLALYKDDGDRVAIGATLAFVDTVEIGDGANGNVQAPAKGTGTGPTTPTAIVGFVEEYHNGTKYYRPLYQ